jgi:acyl dehydratase
MSWDGLTEGSELVSKTVGPVTRTDIVRYQGASGDLNPIHHDEPFAKESGFPAPVGVGMFHAGALAAWAAEQVGPRTVRRTRVRFRQPVFPGDLLTFAGRVVRRWTDETGEHLEAELSCSKEAGVCVQGWMTFTR